MARRIFLPNIMRLAQTADFWRIFSLPQGEIRPTMRSLVTPELCGPGQRNTQRRWVLDRTPFLSNFRDLAQIVDFDEFAKFEG